MLISRVSEEGDGRPPAAAADHSHEYQTASELFDLMAKNHPFDSDVDETLSTRDLVILYKNIDLGTKLMSNAEELKRRKPNQHVETVVYNDEADSASDVSEIYGTEDLHDVYAINSERLDLFNSGPSLENTLCQKLGDLQIQASDLSVDYDQNFLFKDPYIKEQLKNLNRMSGECDGMALPASLLDYICCKRLEDNYNFYMENIIRYVKHTIEQLKRISNGDYLTDKAKEKWREVKSVDKEDDNTKVLATSTSIPLQVERKVNGHSTTWDDIIHSEVDVRSLSKILEKKIIVEVPKLICGSYKLFSKFCSDNLIISCQREEETVTEKMEPRVDVVLQLERSDSGQVMSNINSMIIVQATPPLQLDERPKPLPLAFIENKEESSDTENEKDNPCTEDTEKNVKTAKIVEIQETISDGDDLVDTENSNDDNVDITQSVTANETLEEVEDTNFYNDWKSNSAMETGDSSDALRDILDTRAIPDIFRKEAPYNFISPDDITLSMHRLNMSTLPEESGDEMPQNTVQKKKSNTKNRIKSPYENKSHIIEEKKRKRLLEIRERREKKKMAGGESKISKHRYGKGHAIPHASGSVTKLSITNKSFYNSIYGQNTNVDNKSIPCKGRKSKRELCIDTQYFEGEHVTPISTPEKNGIKYVNRSYYLDEAVTEMMYTQLKQSDCSSGGEMFSASTSADTSSRHNRTDPPESDVSDQFANGTHGDHFDSDKEKTASFDDKPTNLFTEKTESLIKINSSRVILSVPVNSPKDGDYIEDEDSPKKTVPTVECRKSIDKLYNLMKRLGKVDLLETKPSTSKLNTNTNRTDAQGGQGASTIPGSDSGTSLKHHPASSNPSSFSFEKIPYPEEIPALKLMSDEKNDAPATIVPKVIISSKQQTVKVEAEKVKKDRKRVAINTLTKIEDNPLKAISQLIHEFDSVQKTRQRPPSDPKPVRKLQDISFEGRNALRQSFTARRRSRIDQPARENEIPNDKNIKTITWRDRRPRPNPMMEPLKIPHQQTNIEEKHDRIVREERHTDRAVPAKDNRHLERFTKKKIADIIDEVKEAKGEAVRGPSKLHSRLNSLAQPKKSYVQAHSEEYQTKYGKNLMADRLQRLASVPPERQASVARNKFKRPNAEASSAVSVRPPPSPQPLERGRRRRSAGGSPEAPSPPAAPLAPLRQSRATDSPDNIKNKMVAVESYVHNHFGRPALPLGVHAARAPLVPNNLDLGSEHSSPTEDSTAIGSKLHRIIDSILNANPAPLAALAETPDPSAALTPPRDPSSRFSPTPSSEVSDYRVDIFEDKQIKTAVESFEQINPEVDAASENTGIKYEESTDSAAVLQKLQDALHGCMLMKPFPKRRRVKNLTLASKESKRQMLLVHSGDAASVLLESTISKSLKLSVSRSDVSADFNTLPALENPPLDWKFRSNIPVQISTVGYAFPEYQAAYCGQNLGIRSLDNIFKLGISVSSVSAKGNKKSDKTSQCFKGSQSKYNIQDITVSTLNNQDAMPVSRKKATCTASVATEAPTDNNIEKTCGDCMNMIKDKPLTDTEKLKEKKGDLDNADCTSSLDILVGLLNEIEKITTCHITDTVQYADKRECGESLVVVNDNVASKPLKDTVKNNNSHELVSIASLDRLRQLESSQSIYSLYLSDGDKESIEGRICIPRLTKSLKDVICAKLPSHVDKKVGADLHVVPAREYINTFTDVPSKIFPITITHSTNVTNSLIGILSKPSSQSIISLDDYETAYSDSTFNCNNKITEILEESNISQMPAIKYLESEKQLETRCKVVNENKIISSKVHKVKSEIDLFVNQSEFYRKSSDFDPLFKMKRDILVTMYSMLVLTVFAALSFPEILYHV